MGKNARRAQQTKAKPHMPSCQTCRSRHIACSGNGVDPCPCCVAKGLECVYPKKRKAGPRKGWMEERMRQHEEVCAELSAAKSTIRELRSLLARNGIPIPNSVGDDEEEYALAIKAEPIESVESAPKRRKRTRQRSSRALEAEANEPLVLEQLNDSARELSTRGEYRKRLPTLRRIPSGSAAIEHFDGAGSMTLARDSSLRLMRDVSQGSGFFKDLQLSRESSWNKNIDKWAEQMVADELINGQDDDDFSFPDPELLLNGGESDTATHVIIAHEAQDSNHKIETQMPAAITCSQSAARAPHAYHTPQLVTASGAA